MGGIDLTGELPEYCIFINVRKNRTSTPTDHDEYVPIFGPVMVTKHPVMHPRDVRMLLAVDLPVPRVSLFSKHGKRPETDKMN